MYNLIVIVRPQNWGCTRRRKFPKFYILSKSMCVYEGLRGSNKYEHCFVWILFQKEIASFFTLRRLHFFIYFEYLFIK